MPRVKKYTVKETHALVEELREQKFHLENKISELKTMNLLLVKLLAQSKSFKALKQIAS